MAQWDYGYVTDVAYTSNASHETTPSWLAACSILLGHRAPDLSAPFRYADLGCGNGLNVLLAAATNPHAEIWGFDFNPTHVENAREMAARAGLTNARFEEISFEELTSKSQDPFDFVISHGVLSWISLENRRHLTNAIGRLLRPGGLAYLSYNTSPGWSGVEPIRLLMRQLAQADHRRTDHGAADIFKVLDQLRTGGATFFRAHPGLDARIEQMRVQDPRYIAHEFLNRDWHPVMFADVADAMAGTKTHYIGTATLMENVDAVSVQKEILPLLQTTRDADTAETIRDLASAKSFRRDLWRKGGEPLSSQEQIAQLDRMTLMWTGKEAGPEISFQGPIGTVTGQPEFYRPLLDAVQALPVTIGQLRALPELSARMPGEFIQGAILMMGGGYVHPAWPHGSQSRTRQAAARLNDAIIDRLRLGVAMMRVAAPAIGSSLPVEVMEGFVIGRLLKGGTRGAEALTEGVLSDVLESGRSLLKDGRLLTEPGEARAMVSENVRGVLSRRLALLQQMGILE